MWASSSLALPFLCPILPPPPPAFPLPWKGPCSASMGTAYLLLSAALLGWCIPAPWAGMNMPYGTFASSLVWHKELALIQGAFRNFRNSVSFMVGSFIGKLCNITVQSTHASFFSWCKVAAMLSKYRISAMFFFPSLKLTLKTHRLSSRTARLKFFNIHSSMASLLMLYCCGKTFKQLAVITSVGLVSFFPVQWPSIRSDSQSYSNDCYLLTMLSSQNNSVWGTGRWGPITHLEGRFDGLTNCNGPSTICTNRAVTQTSIHIWTFLDKMQRHLDSCIIMNQITMFNAGHYCFHNGMLQSWSIIECIKPLLNF